MQSTEILRVDALYTLKKEVTNPRLGKRGCQLKTSDRKSMPQKN